MSTAISWPSPVKHKQKTITTIKNSLKIQNNNNNNNNNNNKTICQAL